MSDPTTLQWIQVTAGIIGAIIGTILTSIFNWFSKKRQQERDMWRLKMETISKFAPLYNKIALYNANNLSVILKTDPKTRHEDDYKMMMYYLCNILNLKQQINDSIGDLQLTDLESETIIGDLLRTIFQKVKDHFGHLDTSRMTYLTENGIPYHKFHPSVSDNGDNHSLYTKFKEWVAQRDICEELSSNCRWFAELVMYELNHVYQIWYGEKPQFDKLSVGLLNYLDEKHSEYFRRIIKLETGSHLK